MRKNESRSGPLDKYLVGSFAKSKIKGRNAESRYLALHLRFEIDMVAHSLCEFGGGEEERRELEAYRRIHFPALVELRKTNKYVISLDSQDPKGLHLHMIYVCMQKPT